MLRCSSCMKHHFTGTRQNAMGCPQCMDDVKAILLKQKSDLDKDSTHGSRSGKGNKNKENLDSLIIKGEAHKGGKMRQETLNEITKDRDARDAMCMDIC